MKKLLVLLLSVLMITGLMACSRIPSVQQESTEIEENAEEMSLESSEESPAQASANGEKENTEESAIAEEALSDILVVYFSMPETTEPDNMTEEEDNSTVVIDGEVLGNTQYVAYVIQKNTGADLFRIEPVTPYPTDHRTLVDLAKKEQNESARPELKAAIENLDQYQIIFVGYPNWWGDMPMILYSFFDEHDFSGKTIIPFNTHGGSGFSDTINTIAELEPEASVNQEGFTVSRDDVAEAEGDILAWLSKMGFME